jgi:hypothetical protein
MFIAEAVPAKLSKRLPGRRYDRRFFFAMTVVLAAVVAIGFAPTYYLAGGFLAPLPSRIIHIHAAVFSTWMILLVVQTGLISAKLVGWHRKLGMVGFVLAVAMVVTVVLAGADLASRAKGASHMEQVLGLLVVTFTDAVDFAVFAGFAYALRKHTSGSSSSPPLVSRGPLSIAGTSPFCSIKCTQPMMPRMFFFSFWPHMTCGPRARFIARRCGEACFWSLWGSSPALSDQPRPGMRLHTGCRVGEYDGERRLPNGTAGNVGHLIALHHVLMLPSRSYEDPCHPEARQTSCAVGDLRRSILGTQSVRPFRV